MCGCGVGWVTAYRKDARLVNGPVGMAKGLWYVMFLCFLCVILGLGEYLEFVSRLVVPIQIELLM